MARRVGICAVAQTTVEHDKWYERFQGMALEVLEKLREQVAVEFSRHTGKAGIDMSINVSDDVFDARTISDARRRWPRRASRPSITDWQPFNQDTVTRF